MSSAVVEDVRARKGRKYVLAIVIGFGVDACDVHVLSGMKVQSRSWGS